MNLLAHLDTLRWERRIILWRAPETDPERAWAEIEAAHGDAFREYQLDVFRLDEDAAVRLFPAGPETDAPVRFALDRSASAVNAGVPPGGSILIGFDGGVKARQGSPTDWTRHFAAIEQMPMRRAEVRREE